VNYLSIFDGFLFLFHYSRCLPINYKSPFLSKYFKTPSTVSLGHLACTAWVESLSTRYNGRGKLYRSCQKHHSLSLHDLLHTGRHLLRASFITSLKSHLCTPVTTYNTTQSNCIISHAQNTTAFQSNVFLSVMYGLVAKSKEHSASPNSNHYQGQLQTPQSVTVPKGHFSQAIFAIGVVATPGLYLSQSRDKFCGLDCRQQDGPLYCR
jgi:hypothetical protein